MNKLFELIRRHTKTHPDFELCKYCGSRNEVVVPNWGCFDPKIFKYIVVFIKKDFVWEVKQIFVGKYQWLNGVKEPFDIVGAGWSTIHVSLDEFDLDKAKEIAKDILYQKIFESENA